MSAGLGSTASRDPLALIPAAGFATRLGSLPCSKEILPLGWSEGSPIAEGKPLITHLLDRLCLGGFTKALIITREEKRDICDRLGDGSRWGLQIEYLMTEPTSSTVETLDRAYEASRGRSIALGYPDIVFQPRDAYLHIVGAQQESGADIVLGLFPSHQPEQSDMVELDREGRVVRLVIKQPDRGLLYTWSIATWSPAFTEYLHQHSEREGLSTKEVFVGDVIQLAIRDGLRVQAEVFARGASVDLGTPRVLASPPAWID